MSLEKPLSAPLTQGLVKPLINNDAEIWAAQDALIDCYPFKNSLVSRNGSTATFTRASTQAYTDVMGNAQTAAINEPAFTGAAIVLQGAHDAEALTDLQVSTTGMPVNDHTYSGCFQWFSGDGSNPRIAESYVDASNSTFIRYSAGVRLQLVIRIAGVNTVVNMTSGTLSSGDVVYWAINQDSTDGVAITSTVNGVEYTNTNASTADWQLGSVWQLANANALNAASYTNFSEFAYFNSPDITLAGAEFACS